MSDFQDRTIQDLYRLKRRSAQWHSLQAANEVGIFSALDSGQKTAKQLAESLSLDEQAVGKLMQVLVQTEMIEQYGNDFALTTLGNLLPEALRNLGAPSWQQLASHLRTSKAMADGAWEHEVHAREWTMTPAALNAIKCLDIGATRKGLRILDVGCGSGVFGVAFAHRDPTASVTFLDREDQLQRAKDTIDKVGVTSKISWAQCDPDTELEQFEAEEPFDLIVVANRVHRMNVLQQEAMYLKLYSMLASEGELALVDAFPGQESGQEDVAIFELESSLRVGGNICDAPRIEYSLKACSFRQVQFAWLPCEPHLYGLMLAAK